MTQRFLTLRIQRFNREQTPSHRMETFHAEWRKGMNLLEALLKIQDEQDGTLAFRYSCRGAVCGSCAMRVNGRLVLACRTPVEDLLGKPVLIEPLPFFPVIRDLIVDMKIFFDHYRQIDPYLHAKPIPPDRETAMPEKQRKEVDSYANCILCGICFGDCPAFEMDPQFLGPAVLAKAYRFLADSRDEREGAVLETVDGQRGVWGCKTVFNCVKVCPKEVPPTHAILTMRRKMLKHRFSSLANRLKSLPSSREGQGK